MPNLKWASLRNNYISDVSKLANYKKIQELSLENNLISDVEPLTGLTDLIQLNLSSNSIKRIEWTASFKFLMQLSLENNKLTTVRPFSRIMSLMELYLGNNSINDLFAIFPLKDLPRLIILDLAGNDVCHIPSYKMFTIFHLNHLKILNGSGITAKDQGQSKEEFLGKLTIELLGEKIGHFSFKNITELDLRNCKIREVDCLASGEFKMLTKLNFDNNLLVNIDCFNALINLRYLSLNNNRIERLLSTDAALQNNPIGGMEMYEVGRTSIFLSQLEELYLGNNQITRIADLSLFRMPHLRILFLQGNKINKIDGLEHMTNLLELVLDRNQIRGADPLSFLSLINLKALHLKDNRIRSLTHFDCMPNLQLLFLANNRIHELSEVEMKLPCLVEISLSGNSVSRKQLCRIALVIRFPQLSIIDSREVTEDERQKAHAYTLEQYLVREDSSKMLSPILHGSQTTLTNAKNTVKITSVVLDGIEMKLGSHGTMNGRYPG